METFQTVTEREFIEYNIRDTCITLYKNNDKYCIVEHNLLKFGSIHCITPFVDSLSEIKKRWDQINDKKKIRVIIIPDWPADNMSGTEFQ